MNPIRVILLLTCGIALNCNLYAQKKQVAEGNKLYQDKKYQEAAAAYQKALTEKPDYLPGVFNLGNSLIQQKQYEAARKTMLSAEKLTTDPSVQANANYNVGNSFMEEQKWEEAIEAYKKALRKNPNDEAAKYNLSYARAMLKKQEGGGGSDNKQDQNKEDKQDQDQNQQNNNQDEQKDQQEQQQDQSSQNNQQEQQEQQEQKPQPQPSKLTEQQAEQLLNALAQEEKKLHDKKDKQKGTPVNREKDW